MVTSLYLTSIEPAGKTALCASIGKDLIKQGRKVGYFIPVEILDEGKTDVNRDASFVKDALQLDESTEKIAPVHASPMELWEDMSAQNSEFMNKVESSYKSIAAGKDVVIMEGPGGLVIDGTSTLACYRVSELLKASVIVVLRYSKSLSPEVLKRVKGELKGRLAGVVINFVPEGKFEQIKQRLSGIFEKEGIMVLGLIPEYPALLGVTVEELARGLGGRVVTAQDRTGRLVENIMLGAMTIDPGISYFSRKPNKAAVIRHDRPDMQLAALETSTACIILTGDNGPVDDVLYQAEQKQVPIISVKTKTEDTVDGIANILAKSAFDNQQKLKVFQQILGKYLDYKPLYTATGLTN